MRVLLALSLLALLAAPALGKGERPPHDGPPHDGPGPWPKPPRPLKVHGAGERPGRCCTEISVQWLPGSLYRSTAGMPRARLAPVHAMRTRQGILCALPASMLAAHGLKHPAAHNPTTLCSPPLPFCPPPPPSLLQCWPTAAPSTLPASA